MIVKELKTAFIHIPKCAGSSVEVVLANAAGFKCTVTEDIKDVPEVAERFFLYCVRPEYVVDEIQHIPASVYYYLLGRDYPRYFSFSFVRNPYDRLRSEFCELIRSQARWQGAVSDIATSRWLFVQALREAREFLASLGFAQQKLYEDKEHLRHVSRRPRWISRKLAEYKINFIRETGELFSSVTGRRIPSQPSFMQRFYMRRQYHWLPQAYFLNNEVDFVGRVENMAEDWGRVQNRLGIKMSLPFINVSADSEESDETEWFHELYTNESIELVNEIYQEDFERFEYEIRT